MENNEFNKETSSEIPAIPVEEASTSPAASAPAEEPGKVLALLSFIAGLVSVLCCSGVPFGIASIILGVIAKKQGNTTNKPTLGIVLGIIGLVLYVIMMIASTVLGAIAGAAGGMEDIFANMY